MTIISPTELNVVVVAKDLNLSIFKPGWLDRHGIAPDSMIRPGSIVSDMTTQAVTEHFTLLFVPGRIQLTLNPNSANYQAIINDRLVRLLQLLPHTPYSACGFNLTYLVSNKDASSDFYSWNKSLCSNVASSACLSDPKPSDRFGCYFSTDWKLNFRLRVDMKPSRITGTKDGSPQVLQVGDELFKVHFNFHLDLNSNDDASACERVITALKQWDEAESTCGAMIQRIQQVAP